MLSCMLCLCTAFSQGYSEKVSSLQNIPYTITIQLTFEDSYLHSLQVHHICRLRGRASKVLFMHICIFVQWIHI